MNRIFFLSLVILYQAASGQSLQKLTVEKIMRDQKWIGTSPSNPTWSHDSKTLYFNWNPDSTPADSVYAVTLSDLVPKKTTPARREERIPANASLNIARTAYTFTRNGDVFLLDIKTNTLKQITRTTIAESNPVFAFHDSHVVYSSEGNLFSWDIKNGILRQLTDFRKGNMPSERRESGNAQENWLRNDQLQWMEVLKTRKQRRDSTEAANKRLQKKPDIRTVYTGDKTVFSTGISPDGRYVTYQLYTPPAGNKNTIVPNYVTESGFTTDIPARTKVGNLSGNYEFYIYDRIADTVIAVKPDQLPGINELPDYAKELLSKDSSRKPGSAKRAVRFSAADWSDKGTHALIDIRSQDNKDRWLMLLDAATGKLRLLDRQRDEAWVGGPALQNRGWINEHTCFFVSEQTGFSHVYTINVATNERNAVTTGRFEVQDVQLSSGKQHFYISTNAVHPGEQHFYSVPVKGGTAERITTMTGSNQVTLSPDEKHIAILYSYSNKPWELYLQENKPGAVAKQVTFKAASPEFKSYPWRDPEIITFAARDGVAVYGRLYKPATPHPSKPAVVFVHGAGYLQNSHKWWSSYSREYMFHNLLADLGYTVLDIDYRGSAGYGRDWRTGIYRHMGGKDLSDHIDAANWLVRQHQVDPKRIGIYGGSYGGFITLMAMFTQPDVFAAGAALRSVTDWAHYNHGYTSNILNEPFTDTLAYRRSSPIYFAEGLKGHLLMCHGMVDVNVHFQDIVRLTQRLIELGKDNWELAVYPVEDHGFVEPSSWTDEYKRILKLFERVLKEDKPQ